MGKDPVKLIEEITKVKYEKWKRSLELVISAETEDEIDCLMPNLIYHIEEK